MSDGILRKPDKDFTKEVDEQIPKAQELAKVHYYDSIPVAGFANCLPRPG